MTDLPAKLRALADWFDQDEYGTPLTGAETCRAAAELIEWQAGYLHDIAHHGVPPKPRKENKIAHAWRTIALHCMKLAAESARKANS